MWYFNIAKHSFEDGWTSQKCIKCTSAGGSGVVGAVVSLSFSSYSCSSLSCSDFWSSIMSSGIFASLGFGDIAIPLKIHHLYLQFRLPRVRGSTKNIRFMPRHISPTINSSNSTVAWLAEGLGLILTTLNGFLWEAVIYETQKERWIDYTAFVDVALLYKIFDEVTFGQHVWMTIYQMCKS